MKSSDLVTVWSGALETEAIRAQQRPAALLPRRERAPCQQIFDYLTMHRDSTMREISNGLGLNDSQVNGALYSLLTQGRIRRSHRQEDNRSIPVRWSVRGGGQ